MTEIEARRHNIVLPPGHMRYFLSRLAENYYLSFCIVTGECGTAAIPARYVNMPLLR